ncbi:hypothetical protein ACFYOI_14620 [Streptomyces microflavus]|nr:hypothetical protein [Streptomyces cyaneofuscatus]WSD45165.1 hypothetical protein OG857_04760 [Streptomyces cyaneofuscatus]WTA88359.1 hypothetical protein OG323_04840 [Streptomyces cyaneofuscatus]
MNEVRRDKSDLDRLVIAKWVIDQEEWQCLVVEIGICVPESYS